MKKQTEKTRTDNRKFLPTSAAEMKKLGWREVDFLIIGGDAYVDHPSFGIAIVSRLLESFGFKVGVIPQPNWREREAFNVFGRPRLGVLVTGGNLDSMLSNYSSPGKKRRVDSYSANGQSGLRPDRATIVYCNRVRELWGDIPLIIGGIEASLRRIAHYDYWSDAIRRSMLTDSRADLLIYGMAEYQLEAVARRLSLGEGIGTITDLPGTCWKTHDCSQIDDPLILDPYDKVAVDKRAFADSFAKFYREQNFADGRTIVQDQGPWFVVCNRPAPPLSAEELDRIYDLPYTRLPHPRYDGDDIPALREVKFSITAHRGCFGECAFCAISSHQGRVVQARSDAGILKEAKLLTTYEDFKGYIHDVGGPTANFHQAPCKKSQEKGCCKERSCLYPQPCENLGKSHKAYLELLTKLRKLPGIKKVFIRSGIRYDYILASEDGARFMRELCQYHVSGQLKVAPEHISDNVLRFMKKSGKKTFLDFVALYNRTNKELGLKQFLVPYFICSHPGSTVKEAQELKEFIEKSGMRPQQVQDFTPTPGTLASAMYHTGIDPLTGESVPVERSAKERSIQRALLQYWLPENRKLLHKHGIKC